jgi:hypothetical protein
MKPLLPFLAAAALLAPQQPPAALYDEAKVPAYVLPDPLVLNSGERVRDAKAWVERRRPEILEMYRTEVFGRAPAKAPHLAFHADSTALSSYGVPHIYQKVTISFADAADAPRAYMVVYLPAAAKKPVPVFLGLSFAPVQTVYADPAVPLLDQWVLDPATKGVVRKASEESSRGAAASRWQLETILQHGYGLATIYYGDVEPDFAGGMSHGIRALFLKPGQAAPAPDEWGAISAWAWALSRAMDYLETDRLVDAKRVAVIGHSRLGKTALWAGAQDPRFSIVISNESGEGGAAISRRLFGERTTNLNTTFPHWFCGNFKKYDDREDRMPFDAHFLLSLIAPRALYVASAEEDRWSDPRGEFLAAVGAGPVYELLGRKGLGTDAFPALNQSIGSSVRYHVRAGKHDVTAYDWQQYLRFADEQWGQAGTERQPLPKE